MGESPNNPILASVGKVKVTKGDVKQRTKLIALRLTEAEKAAMEARLRAAGWSSFQEAFESYLESVSRSDDAAETALLAKREEVLSAWKAVGKTKMRRLVNLYKSYAADLGLDGSKKLGELQGSRDEILARMELNWNEGLTDVILFKRWMSLAKELRDMEQRLKEAMRLSSSGQAAGQGPEGHDSGPEGHHPAAEAGANTPDLGSGTT